jgi:CubicO group peptidase (beta-lactamase class C family)
MSNKRFKSVKEALEMFKADPLLSEPGKEFHYTTHGFTLLSAVLEKADGARDFKELLRELFKRLDMRHTHLDDDQEPIVLHRTRHILFLNCFIFWHLFIQILQTECWNASSGERSGSR